jgi:PAS domain-containing protein
MITEQTLHTALVHATRDATVVVDETGTIVEWNPAAERCTGIARTAALGRLLWEVQAGVAPAAMPYEAALATAHDQFEEFILLSRTEGTDWHRTFESDLLSAHGTLHTIRTEVFPLIIGESVLLASVFRSVATAGV